MNHYLVDYYNWLLHLGLTPFWSNAIKITTVLIVIVILSILSNYIFKRIIVQTITQVIKRTKNKWDDILLEQKVFDKLSHFAPAIVIYFTIKYAFVEKDTFVDIIQKGMYIYMIIVSLIFFKLLFNALNDIYLHSSISKNRPIKGYLQLLNIFLVSIGVILIYSLITGNEVKGVLTGLGAMAAILLLIFKDTILGFVASIQLSSNNMVKIGDWISMPSKGADGTVLEITLNTVKVQNWDKTISTIPTYALVSESFSNWKGMEESGGRRIKRSINIDMRSVHFCSKEQLDKLQKIKCLSDYIINSKHEMEKYNAENGIDDSIKVNGRRLTNLGLFRKYLELYLHNNPKIHDDMTFLVRQLQPSERGIPIEIYVFSNDQEWANYEAIQADIFDHILAIIPEFELDVFQNLSGSDLVKAKQLLG